MAKSTRRVADIKDELNGLGVAYDSGLKKADLLSLLEVELERRKEKEVAYYSPPLTRRRTQMVQPASAPLHGSPLSAGSPQIHSPGSPLNHASAIIENYNDISDKDSDFEILEETPVEESRSEVHVLNARPMAVEVPRRRSARLSERQHKASCNAGTLFGEEKEGEDLADVDDSSSTTSSQELQSTRQRTTLSKILLVCIFVAILANLTAYLYLYHPSIASDARDRVLGVYERAWGSERGSNVTQ